jgi:hypothetical protein
MANLTDWKPEILPDIPLASDPALIVGVRNAVREFCEKTHLWIYTLDRFDVVANQAEYPLIIPANLNAELVAVENVKYKQDGFDDDQFVKLNPLSERQQDNEDYANWPFRTAPQPRFFLVDIPNHIMRLVEIPTEGSTQGLLVKTSIKPSLLATTVPDFLRDDYKDVIGDGAKADLFGRPGTPWAAATLAAAFKAKFDSGIGQGNYDQYTGHTNRKMRARYQEWAL